MRTRLRRWVATRVLTAPWWQEGMVCTPPYVLRRDPLVALVWLILEPRWPFWWIDPYLALPGDRFRSFARAQDVYVLRLLGHGRALCRVVPDEMRLRGWREEPPRIVFVVGAWGMVRTEVREIDLRDGWERVR